MIESKGIAWDQPKECEFLIAVSKEYEKHHPYVTIKWKCQRIIEGNL